MFLYKIADIINVGEEIKYMYVYLEIAKKYTSLQIKYSNYLVSET